MKRRKIVRTGLLALALLLAAAAPAAANSALRYWEGSDGQGAVPRQEDCPLTVERETLTFRLFDVPTALESQVTYDASVTALYAFRNPSAEDVTARLAFPFGERPMYPVPEDAARMITLDGEPVAVELRCTYQDGIFDTQEALARLRDEDVADPFYDRKTPVTRYRFEVEKMPKDGDAPTAAVTAENDPDRRLMLLTGNGWQTKGEDVLLSQFMVEDQPLILYVFGEPFDAPPEWSFYTDGSCGEAAEGGALTLVEETSMTFGELALSGYDPASGYRETDWYNAFVDMMTGCQQERSGSGAVSLGYYEYYDQETLMPILPTYRLMNWYEYEITVPAGGLVQNEVTAPIYPSLDLYYDPAVCEYTYLLSPAGTWADFGALDIRVETSAYLLESSAEFEPAEEGGTAETRIYEAHLPGLPEGELTFRLCESPDPARSGGSSAMWLIPLLLIPVLILLAIVIVIVVIIVLVLRRKKRQV